MIRPHKLPITVNFMASYAFPSKRSLCPGSTDKAVSASGAPKKIDGIKSKKEWVIAIEIINTAIVIGLR